MTCADPMQVSPIKREAGRIVKGDNILGGSRHVGDDEGDARIKLARMPFDLGDHPARLAVSLPTPSVSSFMRSPIISAISCVRWRRQSRSKTGRLRPLKEKLIKIGAKVISHGRYVAFQMAEVAIPKKLFANILRPPTI